MTFSNLCNDIFWKSTNDYHITDSVDAPMNNPYEPEVDRILFVSEELD